VAHFAVICTEAVGHLIPLGCLGHELQRRGHRVTLVARAKATPIAERLKLPLYKLDDDAPEYGPPARSLMAIALLGGGDVALALRSRFCHRAELVLRLLPQALKDLAVDGLLVDQNMVAGGTVADHLGLPYLTVCPALHWNEEMGVPPPFTGWSYSESPWARIRNRLGYAAWQRFMRPVLNIVNRYRQVWKLAAFCRVDDIYSPLAQISQTCAAFDFPRKEIPETFHYVGALTAEGPDQGDQFPWERLAGRKVIYASLGTVHHKRNAVVLQKIAAACAGLDAQLVISCGKWSDETDAMRDGLQNMPGNVLVMDFVPQVALLEKTDLLITHAGVNTVLEALTCAVPMVALPRSFDQPGMGARIEYAGLGLRASFDRFTAEQLRDLIERVLYEETFQQRAKDLQKAMLDAGGVYRAADIAEEALITGRHPRCDSNLSSRVEFGVEGKHG